MAGMVWRILLLSCAFALSACAPPPAPAAPADVELTPLRTINRVEAVLLLRAIGLEDVPVAHDVDCYRMIYTTHDASGRALRVSGLLALPRGAPARRLVSFQHGTSTTHDAVPSKPDGTGLGAAIVFAGNGYALLAPDYIGLGASQEIHPYLVAEDAARAVVDMIRAARRIDGVPNGPVFLSGFSQGGQASMAALRVLEADGETVLAAAPVAGPYDARGVSLGVALRGGAPSHALYLAYMSRGYAAHYGRPLESVLTPDYARRVSEIFGASYTPQQIIAALPANPRALFNADFLEAFDENKPHWLLDAMARSDVSDWAPKTPVRLYYGAADIDVAPEEALHAARAMRARGADVTAVDVGPVGHDPSMLAATPLILAWLAEREAAASQDSGPLLTSPGPVETLND